MGFVNLYRNKEVFFIQVGFHRLQCTRYDTDQNDQQTKGHYVGVCILTWLGGTLIYLLLYTI